MIDPSKCPRPEKRAFGSKQAAKKWLSRIRGPRPRPTTHAYLCECGLYHTGHPRT